MKYEIGGQTAMQNQELTEKTFSCVLLGEEGTLAVQCGELLLAAGHRILAVVSPNAEISNWAQDKGLKTCDPSAALDAILEGTRPDYIFSIANWKVLEPREIAFANRMAINYHDSLLPRYAGGNATNWAILNGETQHGVTWHVMAEEIDAGDVLQHVPITIDPDETAASLNAKCYEAAIQSFSDLIDQIATGTLSPKPHASATRHYNSRYRKPMAAGLIDWRQSAAELERFTRAVDFGSYANSFCLAKFRSDQEFLIVRRIAPVPFPTTAPPGTVLAIDHNGPTIATGDGAVRLEGLQSIEGSPTSLRDVSIGDCLAEHDETVGRIDTAVRRSAAHEAWWLTQLATVEPLNLIPAPRASVKASNRDRYTRHSLDVPETKVTGGADLVAALALYLARLSGQSRIDFALEDADVSQGITGLQGLFAHEVPCLVSVAPNLPVGQALPLATDQIVQIRAKGSYLRDLIARHPERHANMDRLPIVVKIGGDAEPMANRVVIQISEIGHKVVWISDSWRFDQDITLGLATRFGDFLKRIAEHPEHPLATVPMLSREEETRVLRNWNATATEDAQTLCLHQQIERVAVRTPQAPAVRFGETVLSYADLDEQATHLSARLTSRGIGQGDLVGIFMARSPSLVASILAVLKSGAAYVPLDPSHPDDRLTKILEDSRAAAVFVDQSTASRANKLVSADCGVLDASAPANTAPTEPTRPIQAALNTPAYVIYTSGSTGKPKGVVVEHLSAANYIAWARRVYLSDQPGDFPLFTSLAFDLTVTSVFTPLTSGGCIHVYGEDDPTDPTLLQVIGDDAVDVVKLTPSHLALLAGMDLSQSRIHTLILGGEDLTLEVARATVKAFGGGVRICNEYGPTEATVGSMVHVFDPQTDSAASVPIGRPADNVRLYILDQNCQPLPPGVAGELFIAGTGIAREYLGQPDLTAEKFLPDPFAKEGRMYRSGDLARWREDGVMEFLGRADRQIKLRGYRVEIGEIENRLRTHPHITHSVVDLIDPATTVPDADITWCTNCGLPSNFPGADPDTQGVCQPCRRFKRDREEMEAYFRPMTELRTKMDQARDQSKGDYDCLVLFSGGKDSTYVLYQLVKEMGYRVLVFTFENGFISDQARVNIKNACDDLGLELKIGSTKAINDIYVDSLNRHANVCNGCFKTIYTMGMQVAREHGIRTILTGLSRGQILETRLAELFAQGIRNSKDIDAAVASARKVYHGETDAVTKALGTGVGLLDETEFVDFYRYCDVGVDEILDYIKTNVHWVRPETGGCSTNCVINDVGIMVHKQKRGFHNYAWPNSWEVRLGLKNREESIAELSETIDEVKAQRILATIGYRETTPVSDPQLVAWYCSSTDRDVVGLRNTLLTTMPAYMVPSHFIRLDAIPLTVNGKVDRERLPKPGQDRARNTGKGGVPQTETERVVADMWGEILRVDSVGRGDNFFELGGHSLSATRFLSHFRDRIKVRLPLHTLMGSPTVMALAAAADHMITEMATLQAAPLRTEADREDGEL
jgi:amino acid adenylation domain-containing protein